MAVRSGAYDAARVLAEHNLPGLVVTDTAGKTVGDILPTAHHPLATWLRTASNSNIV